MVRRRSRHVKQLLFLVIQQNSYDTNGDNVIVDNDGGVVDEDGGGGYGAVVDDGVMV